MFGNVLNLQGDCVTHFVLDTITVDFAEKQKDQWLTTVNRQQVVRGKGHYKLRLYR